MADMTQIWALMKSMWPHPFKEYGPVNGPVFNVWLSELRGADLGTGLTALRVCTDDFPPSLPKFKKMCGLLLEVPKGNDEMMNFALQHNLTMPHSGESWKGYRKRLQRAVADRAAKSLPNTQKRMEHQ